MLVYKKPSELLHFCRFLQLRTASDKKSFRRTAVIDKVTPASKSPALRSSSSNPVQKKKKKGDHDQFLQEIKEEEEQLQISVERHIKRVGGFELPPEVEEEPLDPGEEVAIKNLIARNFQKKTDLRN